MGPVSGYLIDRLGPRRLVFVGLLVLGGGFLALSKVQTLWQFYLAFVMMSVGSGLGTWMPMMTMLNNWFRRRRAIAMAVAMEGFAIGGVLLVPALAWAIDPEQPGRLGWSNAAQVIGIVVLVLAFPISKMVRTRPEDYGLLPDGEPARTVVAQDRPQDDEEPDYTWQQAISTRSFWLIALGHSCSSIVIVSLMVHLGPMLVDRGLSLPTVGLVVATYTGVGAVFTMVGGYVGDRVPIRLAIFGFSAVQSVAAIVVLLADSTYIAFLFAVLLGIGFGGRTPLTTAIRGVYFGRKAFASITGVSMIPMNIFLFAAPLFAGIMFDATGSYSIPFVTIAIVSFIGAALFLLLGEPEVASARGAQTPQPKA